jgi:flagellar capping protein FliD
MSADKTTTQQLLTTTTTKEHYSRDFHSHSPDAMFATILERLNNQDGVLQEIKAQCQKTNGRTTATEQAVAQLKSDAKWERRIFIGACSIINVAVVVLSAWMHHP